MARSFFPHPPESLTRHLPDDAQDWLHRVHEELWGNDPKSGGKLGVENMKTAGERGADNNVLHGDADGNLNYAPLGVEKLTSTKAGVVQGRDGATVVDRLPIESLPTDDTGVRRGLRSQGDAGAVAFEEDVGSRVSGAVNLLTQKEDPTPGRLENDATEYLRDGFRVIAYKTYVAPTPDPETGDVDPAAPTEVVRYKYMDLRSPTSAVWVSSDTPPIRVVEGGTDPAPSGGGGTGTKGRGSNGDRGNSNLVYDVTMTGNGIGQAVDFRGEANQADEYARFGTVEYRAPDIHGYSRTLVATDPFDFVRGEVFS